MSGCRRARTRLRNDGVTFGQGGRGVDRKVLTAQRYYIGSGGCSHQQPIYLHVCDSGGRVILRQRLVVADQ